MDTEIEATFTQIDPKEVRERLRKLGAQCIQPERLMRRKNYDYADKRLLAIRGWVRLRDEGDKVTLAYKQLNDRSLHGMQEVSFVVDSFEKAEKFLEAIDLHCKSYEETRRESWTLDGVEIEIDFWPWIPPFVEIEGKSEEGVKKTAAALGFDWSDAKHGSVENVYQEVYDITEEEAIDWGEITFTPVPEWLEARRRRA